MQTRFKNFEGKSKRESPKKTIYACGSLDMVVTVMLT